MGKRLRKRGVAGGSFTVRRFAPEDAGPLSVLIGRTLREINGRDYPPEEVEGLARRYSPGYLRAVAEAGSLYVAEGGGALVGCGAVTPCEGKPSEAYIRAVFTAVERQGEGVGRAVLSALEADPIYRKAVRVELHASISAHSFYQALGYADIGGAPVLVDGCYPMEREPLVR